MRVFEVGWVSRPIGLRVCGLMAALLPWRRTVEVHKRIRVLVCFSGRLGA